MEVAEDLSIHICPQCHHAYRMSGVRPGQEIACFKCGEFFKASQIPETKPTHHPKKELEKMSTPSVAAAPTFEENLPQPKRQGGTWTWLIFFTFILFCFVKAVSLPQNPATVSTAAETVAVAEVPAPTVTETIVPVETAAPMPAAEIPVAAIATATTETPAPVSQVAALADKFFAEAEALFAGQQFPQAVTAYELYFKQVSPSYENLTQRMSALWKSATACEKTGNVAAAKLKYEQLVNEYAREGGWQIRSAKKSLERLAAGTAQ